MIKDFCSLEIGCPRRGVFRVTFDTTDLGFSSVDLADFDTFPEADRFATRVECLLVVLGYVARRTVRPNVGE